MFTQPQRVNCSARGNLDKTGEAQKREREMGHRFIIQSILQKETLRLLINGKQWEKDTMKTDELYVFVQISILKTECVVSDS